MAGSPALFIDGKFISCRWPKSQICLFTQGLRGGHPLADHEPRVAILRDFRRQKPAYSTPESPGIDLDFGDGFAPDSPLQRRVCCEPYLSRSNPIGQEGDT